MYLSNNKYRLAELKYAHLETCAKLLADMFLSENKVWASINVSHKEAYDFMFSKTKQGLDWQEQLRKNGVLEKTGFINYVYLDQKDNIVGVWTNMQLMQHLSKKSQVQLPQFNTLQKYGHELQKSIDPKDIKIGFTIYAVFFVIKPELMNSGIPLLFTYDGYHHLFSQGFRLLYGRASSPKLTSLVLRTGNASVTAKITAIENGNEINLTFIRQELSPLFVNQPTLKKLLIQAKL